MRAARIALPAVLALVLAAPVALAVTAGPFGPVEVADPDWRPGDNVFGGPLIGVDGQGNALWATFARDANGDDQMASYERCGTTWKRSLIGTAGEGFIGEGLEVAPDGTALAVWRAEDAGGTTVHHSSVRPPGGTWGPQQVIVTGDGIGNVQFALSDNGSAIAVWTDDAPAGTWASVRPAGGSWGAPEPVVGTMLRHDVAISASGDAVVLYQGATPGFAFAKYRPAGGIWSGAQLVLENAYLDTMQGLMVEFDGTGRAIALGEFREFTDTVRMNVRGAGLAGAWGATDQVLDDDGNPPSPLFDLRSLQALERHPQGVIAVWLRQSTSSNFNHDIVVSRFSNAGWETPKVFDAPNRYTNASVATNAAGEILLAGTLNHGPSGGVEDIRATIAPSLTAPWPDMALVSPAGSSANSYRDAVAGGGGPELYVAWGVHGAGNQRTEVITTAPPTTCGTATPTPTPTPTADPAATPDPSPNPLPGPSPTPTPTPTASPSAIADFTTLPPASKCVRGRKLTLRLKRPPKGYTVKAVTVKVNSRRVATLKGKQLKKPLYLRRLPRGTFTVTVSITLTKGKGLTERRRYTACR